MGWMRMPDFLTTNGNWFGTLGSGFIDTFQLSSSGTFENITSFQSPAKMMQFLGDNTLLLISETSLATYQFISNEWTKIHEQNVNFMVRSYFTLGDSTAESAPHVTDTTLAAFNPINATVELYTRNEDKSWRLVDEISLDISQYEANRIIWNGDDTVVLAHTNFKEVIGSVSYGRLLILEKLANGTWNMTRVINNAEVSTTLPGYLGFAMLLFDPNVILVTAPSKSEYGEVLVLQRRSGQGWEFTLKFVGSYERNLFGYSLSRTDYDIIVQSGHFVTMDFTNQVAISECYLPIQHECSSDIFDTCQTELDIPVDQLYTVQDNCTALHLDSFRVGKTSTTVSFRLTRDFSDTRTCNVTVHCTSTPEGSTPPSNSQTPVSVPMIGIIPISTPKASITSTAPSVWFIQLHSLLALVFCLMQ